MVIGEHAKPIKEANTFTRHIARILLGVGAKLMLQ